jgi:hypothetical protein
MRIDITDFKKILLRPVFYNEKTSAPILLLPD